MQKGMEASNLTMNEIRRSGVVEQFRANIGTRMLLFMETYPFFIVGTLEREESGFAYVRIELSNITELDNSIIRVHIDEIQVFYFESEGVQIPSIQL
ncbi:hypothetical protein [Paenibacillus tarimensis]|uniref:hypothetical protein n=1 Tax=Paenibacillus tarimensis TaxID=416012 RepID=UPI001F3FBCBD|nr:hypothetical protein [Paenibacillus tarimensis]MCF2945554.1 hypothetical protein [Paenibacillus tarimensis]